MERPTGARRQGPRTARRRPSATPSSVTSGPWTKRTRGDRVGIRTTANGTNPTASRLRGWIPPDDRLWRHPSESGRSAAEVSPVTADHRRPHQGRSTGPWILGGAAACVVVALVAAGLVMVATGTEQSSTETTPGWPVSIGVPTTDPGLRRAARRGAIESMVALGPAVDGRPAGSTATVVPRPPPASWSSPAASSSPPRRSLAGARSITAIEPDGTRQPATLVGIDQTSGLAVLRIDDDLPGGHLRRRRPRRRRIRRRRHAQARLGRPTPSPRPSSTPAAVVSSGWAFGADAGDDRVLDHRGRTHRSPTTTSGAPWWTTTAT